MLKIQLSDSISEDLIYISKYSKLNMIYDNGHKFYMRKSSVEYETNTELYVNCKYLRKYSNENIK